MGIRKPKSLNINKDFLVDDSLIIKEITKKNRIILNDTCRLELSHHINSFPLLKKIPHYTIDRDGIIYEHISTDNHSNYYPEYSNINETSIIVSFMNAGGLIPKNGFGFINWALDNVTDQKDVYEFLWKTYRYWHKYTPEQIKSFKQLSKYICAIHTNIKPVNIFGNSIYDERAIDYEGVISESNLFSNSYSVNPNFIY